MLPKVVLHVESSLDGRIDHLRPDVARYYRVAGSIGEDAVLTGADTLLQAEDPPAHDEAPTAPAGATGSSPGPLLAVTDSRCRFRHWTWLRAQPYWRDVVVLVAGASPPEGLARLAGDGIATLTVGERRVDLRAALELLAERHGVRVVRVDSGGSLSGALTRLGLIDQVSVLLEPLLVGGEKPRPFLRGPEPTSDGDVLELRLEAVETLADGVVWLRYVRA
jgi:2,5-diamino-6-(ribosylamino)-4(3H)-pyrimidinone 5'-phosphate reductase